MNIAIENSQKDIVICEDSLRILIRELLHIEKISTDEISICLVSREEAAQLHQRYFSDSTDTDCMTFPIDPPHTLQSLHCLGEIVVCPHTALTEHSSYNTTLSEELSLYIIHSFLHLIGFTDKSLEKKLEMRQRETMCLDHLRNNRMLLEVTKACC